MPAEVKKRKKNMYDLHSHVFLSNENHLTEAVIILILVIVQGCLLKNDCKLVYCVSSKQIFFPKQYQKSRSVV